MGLGARARARAQFGALRRVRTDRYSPTACLTRCSPNSERSPRLAFNGSVRSSAADDRNAASEPAFVRPRGTARRRTLCARRARAAPQARAAPRCAVVHVCARQARAAPRSSGGTVGGAGSQLWGNTAPSCTEGFRGLYITPCCRGKRRSGARRTRRRVAEEGVRGRKGQAPRVRVGPRKRERPRSLGGELRRLCARAACCVLCKWATGLRSVTD